MDRFREIELFVQVAELGSLSLAADRLGVSNAAASRFLQALETRLGVRLVERTTRRLSLTDAGQQYHRRCAAILAEMDDATAEAMELATIPKGTLRLTSSVSFAMLHIAPALGKFREIYPQLAVQLITSNIYRDFIDAGIDVAIRTREFEVDSSLTIRKLADTQRVIAGSPEYLARRGTPRTIHELSDHDVLIYSLANQPSVLRFSKGSKTQNIRVAPSLEFNESQVVRTAALSGAGLLVLPLFAIYDDIVAGRLVPVLTEWDLPPLSIHMAYQSRRHQPAKITAFVDFFTSRFHRIGIEQMLSAIRQ